MPDDEAAGLYEALIAEFHARFPQLTKVRGVVGVGRRYCEFIWPDRNGYILLCVTRCADGAVCLDLYGGMRGLKTVSVDLADPDSLDWTARELTRRVAVMKW